MNRGTNSNSFASVAAMMNDPKLIKEFSFYSARLAFPPIDLEAKTSFIPDFTAEPTIEILCTYPDKEKIQARDYFSLEMMRLNKNRLPLSSADGGAINIKARATNVLSASLKNKLLKGPPITINKDNLSGYYIRVYYQHSPSLPYYVTLQPYDPLPLLLKDMEFSIATDYENRAIFPHWMLPLAQHVITRITALWEIAKDAKVFLEPLLRIDLMFETPSPYHLKDKTLYSSDLFVDTVKSLLRGWRSTSPLVPASSSLLAEAFSMKVPECDPEEEIAELEDDCALLPLGPEEAEELTTDGFPSPRLLSCPIHPDACSCSFLPSEPFQDVDLLAFSIG